MAKDQKTGTVPAVQDPKTTALATNDYGEYAGAGFENQTNEDVSIPFLGVLQPQSPEMIGSAQERIPGGSLGRLFNTVTKELYPEEGIVFQPVDTKHVFVEWKPKAQGGGIVATHQIDSPVVENAKAASEKFGKYKVGQNDLVETFYVLGLLHRSVGVDEAIVTPPEPIMLAFTSTKIKVYKGIMTRLRSMKGAIPLFAHRVRIKGVTEQNTAGTFGNFHIEPLVGNDVQKSLIPARKADGGLHPLITLGKELLDASRGGLLKVNAEKQQGSDAAEPGAGGGKRKGDEPPF
jgi:hypothetical protein